MGVVAVEFVYSSKRYDDFTLLAKFTFGVDCCEDIYGHYCIQKRNYHFLSLITITSFKVERLYFLFSRVYKLDRDFLNWKL